MTVDTPRLQLVVQNPTEVLRWIESLDPTTKAEVSPVYIQQLRSTEGPDPWICVFELVDRDTRNIVGKCGFIEPRDEHGIVEIVYGVDEAYRGNGHATEAARALVDFCAIVEDVSRVRAHSLASNAASEKVLRKTGFEYMGEVVDPDDGLVNRWEMAAVELDAQAIAYWIFN